MTFVMGLGMFFQVALPVLGGTLAGVLIGSLLARALKLEDRVLSLTGGVVGLWLAFYLSGDSLVSQFTSFALRVWGGADMYR